MTYGTYYSGFGAKGQGDPTKGGTGIFTRRPTKENWRQYVVDFTILYPLAEPYRWLQHGVRVGGKWVVVYCLGSDGHTVVDNKVELNPEGVRKCQSIILPVGDGSVNLHESAGQMDNASVALMYRYIIANWSSNSIQIIDLPDSMLAPHEGDQGGTRMFSVINEYRQRDPDFPLTRFMWRLHCESNGQSYRRRVDPVGESLWKTDQELGAFVRQEGHGKRYKECEDRFGAAMSMQQICEKLGVQVPAGTAPTEGEDYFGREAAGPTPSKLPTEDSSNDPLAFLHQGGL